MYIHCAYATEERISPSLLHNVIMRHPSVDKIDILNLEQRGMGSSTATLDGIYEWKNIIIIIQAVNYCSHPMTVTDCGDVNLRFLGLVSVGFKSGIKTVLSSIESVHRC